MAPLRRDRAAVLVAGLLLLALGLLGLDWRADTVLDLRPTLSTAAGQDAVATAWFPWVGAAVGLVLIVLGLLWLLAHVRRPGTGAIRLAASDHTGRLEVDARSLARAAAADLAARTPLEDVRGSVATHRGTTVVELRGRLAHDAGAAAATATDDLAAAAATAAAQLAAALPDEAVACRVVLDPPRRTKEPRRDRVRVRPATSTTRPHHPSEQPLRGHRMEPKERTMGLADKAKNAAQDALGKAKEVVGDLTDDKELQAEGKADQAESSVKKVGENIKDTFTK
ncbi:hypothetical protein GCM10022215_17280 [Nocardioides fonticola]|uniref:CsbD-like domain-containing protein n=1 Tax=Nocardioides fonticola TaxID=450363 RepID=A0ABP7XHS5_9ACTN